MAFGLSAGAAALVGAVAAPVVSGLILGDNGAGDDNAAATDATRMQSQIAREQWDRYKTMYAPLEQNMVNEAMNYDSPENYSKAAGDASATVSEQFSKARDRMTRTPGLDPSSGAYQASLTGLDLAQAASDATSQNAARQKIKDTAYARKTDALSLGKGLPAQATSALGTAASNSLAQAQFGQTVANGQAAAVGRVADRVFNSPATSNWLGNVSTANTYGTNIGSQQTNMLQQQEIGF